jgi:glycosyltransferase involved in cell wall biosynthesis
MAAPGVAGRDRRREDALSNGAVAARILEITSYPPPRAGWGVRVEFLKKRLEIDGHQCVVLNIGTSRNIPSDEYETVMGGLDFMRKVWRYSRQGFVVHAHANGDALKGLALALVAEIVNLACGRRCYLTFHAGTIQRYFPQHRNRWLAPVFRLLFAIPRRIICNSDAVKRCIAGYGVPASKIVPIPAFSRQYLEFSDVELPPELDAYLAQHPTTVFSYLRLRPLFYPTVLIDGMARVMERRPDVGLVICGGRGHADDGVWPAVEAAMERHGLQSRICFVDDLDHDAFLTALRRSALYLRTPITDGVASSVLEALALGIPVVACDNGTRPRGVVTYAAEDADGLAAAVSYVLDNRPTVVAGLANVEVADTLSDEVALLTS